MRIQCHISQPELNQFESSTEAVVLNVDTATKRATEQACREILEESLAQVPRDTGALASTGFYEVERNMGTKSHTYQGTIGYAGTAGKGAKHPNGGKAKFLEDPVRAYGSSNFKRVAETNWRYAIEGADTILRKR